MYVSMGGELSRIVSPNHIIGKVTAINNAGSWLYVDDPYSGKTRFVSTVQNPDLVFVDGGAPLTDAQKKDVITSAIVNSSGAVNPLAGAAVEGGSYIAEKGTEIATGLFSGLKWLIVGVAVIVVIALIFKFK
jgi:hypothetical protein